MYNENSTVVSLAAAWMRPESDSSWTWDDGGESITWADGSTLTIRDELVHIVSHFIPDRLPPLGLIVLVLAALRGKITPSVGLNSLSSLPADLRTGLRAKLNLISFFTEESSLMARPEQATAVLNLLQSELPMSNLARKLSGPPQLPVYLRILNAPLTRLSIETLRNRMMTGLEAPPEEARLPLTWDSIQVQSLVSDLREDPDLAGIARLVRDFMATLTLPRSPVSPEYGALGGVADIANRGPLHRLLISELALDDDTLALRLALNEALYLKNAPPAAQPQTQLVVIFDAGIRMWGIPRVLAAAAALALLSKAPKKQLSRAWLFRPGSQNSKASPSLIRMPARPSANTPPTLLPIDFSSKEGLLELLSQLELNLHPAPALDLLASLGPSKKGSAELILLTHEETWADMDFRDQVNLYLKNRHDAGDTAPFYVLSFNRDGMTHLRSVCSNGHLLLQSAKIDLEPLMPKLAPTLRSKDSLVPAFVRLSPPPFLLPAPPDLDGRFVISSPQGYSGGLTKRGTFWHWDSSNHGAAPALLPALPGHPVYLSYVETLSAILIVHLETSENEIHIACWTRKRGLKEESHSTFSVTNVPATPLHYFHRYGLLYIVYANQVDVVNLRTGKHLVREALPEQVVLNQGGCEWIGNGFFRHATRGTLCASSLSWTGHVLKFEPITLPGTRAEDVVLMFHREGFEGPWFIDRLGNFNQTCPPFHRLKMDLPANCKPEVSPDGRELWVPMSRGGNVVPLTDDPEKVRHCISRVSWLLQTPSPYYTIRTRIAQIIPESNGVITLISDKARAVRIELNAKKRVFNLVATGLRPLVSLSVRNFEIPIQPPVEAEYTLMAARWTESGAQAILDSRGLLHLQAPDVSIPEITIVLADAGSPLPIWASDGTKIGSPFFLGRDVAPKGDIEKIEDHLRRFCALVQ